MDSVSKLSSTSSVRIKLVQSNSCSSSKKNGQKSNFTNASHPQKSSIDEKPMLIKSILKEIKQEKPLGKCPLFKMALTFSSFVWSNSLDPLYNDSLYQQKESLSLSNKNNVEPLIKKLLVRSNSATSFKSNKSSKTLEEPSCREPLTTDLQTRSASRKDENKMNMLASVAHSSIKLKSNRTKNDLNKQTDLMSQRSLKLGAVPKYLTDRKDEWARQEEERIKNLPDPDCPINHVLMPELERNSTLTQLQNSHKEIMDEYNCLPVSKDTLRIRQKRENLEKKMIKLEEGIRVLSKPKVFVKIDR